MKLIGRMLLLVEFFLANGPSLAATPQPSPEMFSASGAGDVRVAEAADPARGSHGRKEATSFSGSGSSRSVSGKLPMHMVGGRSMKANQPRQVQHFRDRLRTEGLRNTRQPGSIKPAAGAGKIAKSHVSPAFAIDGQQFVQGRSLAASQATLGGPAKSGKNTAALNGSRMPRRR